MYAKTRNGEENTADAYEEPASINEKSKSCFTISVYRTEQCSVCIQKRTDPGQRENKFPGSFTVKQKCPDKPAEDKEEQAA